MATDPKTGQIINDDLSAESIAKDRSAENSNPGDEGPKVPKGNLAYGTGGKLTGSEPSDGSPEAGDQTKKPENKEDK